MMKKNFYIATVTLAFSLVTAPLTALAQDSKPRVIRFLYGLGAPDDSSMARAVKAFADTVDKASGGKLKVQGLPLGSDNQNQQAVAAGNQEMMAGSSATLAVMVKEMLLWDAPFLFNNTDEADAVLDGPVGQKVLSKLPDQGLVGLAYWENGFRNATNSKKPIQTAEDFQGIRFRVMTNPIYMATFNALGATAVPMPFTEVYDALKTKAVDGQENPYHNDLSFKFYEVQKYVTATNHAYSPYVVVVSKKLWDVLSKDERNILLEAAAGGRAAQRRDNRERTAKALAELRAKGMEFSKLAPKETGRLRDKLTKVNASIAGTIGVDLWSEAQSQLAKLRNN